MIARMDRLEIVCMSGVLPDVVNFLQDQGVVHIEEVPLASEELPDFLSRVNLPEDKRREGEALDELNRMFNEVVPLLAVKPNPEYVVAAGNSLKTKSEDELASMAESWGRQLRAYTRRKLNIKDNLEILTNFLKTLESIEPLVQGRSVVLGRDARAFVMKGDVAKALERLDDRRKHEIGGETKLLTQTVSRNTLVGVLMYPQDRNDIVSKIFSEELIAPVELPDRDLKGASVEDVIEKVKLSIAKHNAAAVEMNGKLQDYSKQIGAELTAMAAKVSDRLAQVNAMNRFAQSSMVGVIHGWAPSDSVNTFTTRLANQFPGKVLVSHLPMQEVDVREVPTHLRNHPLLQPFEALLMLLKPPTYGTFDPTALVAISFVLFYGFIIGDAGYALAIYGFGYLLKRKFRHIPLINSVGTVAYWMATSSLLFGLVFGEFFGNFGHKHLGMPVFFERSNADEIPKLMIYAIIFGALHIPLALILGIWADFSHHHKEHAIEKLALLLGLIAIGIAVLNLAHVAFFGSVVFLYLAAALFVAFISLLGYATGWMALVLALEVVSLVGNVLSYCRLMALGLAGVLVADLANQLGEGVGLIIGIPAALLIHTFNIGLSLFSPTIHSLRLNYVEFLPKFYRPEGKSYQPFKKEALW